MVNTALLPNDDVNRRRLVSSPSSHRIGGTPSTRSAVRRGLRRGATGGRRRLYYGH